ncbi:MAG: MFS transporter [Acidimicrobiales bacterium]
MLAGLRSSEAPRRLVTTSIWAQSRRALGYIAADPLLRALAVAQALAALSAGATSALLVVLVRRHLRASTTGCGLALAAIAVGAVAGPLPLSRLPATRRHAPIVFGAFGLRGLVDVALATVRVLPATLGALVGYGFGTSTGNVSFSSLIQTHVPDERRGRVFSAFDLVWHSGRLMSIAAGGAVADAYGIRVVYYLGGTLLLLATATGVVALRVDRPAGAA